jgi:tetratricopeptide (TPR) repeat protein
MKKTLHKQPKLLIEELIKLERCGKYEEAIEELQEIWEDITVFPKVEEFKPRIAAEMILRCGSLIGFLGHNKQLSNAQEKSKNLLTEAHQRFLDIYDKEKIAECENYLALAYWRTGELVEAETWIEEALSHILLDNSQARIYSFLIKSMIFFANGKYEQVRQNLENVQDLFQKYGDAFLNGSYYTNLSLALKNLGNPSEALRKLELAKSYHQKSGHQIYLGTVENNFAQIHKSINDFFRAHQAVDNAIEIYEKIKDKTRKGSSLDTKAQIYFAEGKFADALEMADASIEILERSENSAYLVESYLTKIKILISIDDITSATLCLFDAVQIAKTQISEEAAKDLVKEFDIEIRQRTSPVISNVFTEKELVSGDLELLLPPSIAHYQNYQAVRIKNTHLEEIGLKPDSLAIVVDEKIERGDLAAITEIKDGSIMCGFYDVDFGIVCLEGIDSEPQLLNENEIKVLGKIVGVCDMEKNSDGKFIVKIVQGN